MANKDKAKARAYDKEYRSTYEYRLARRIKRKLMPSEQPEIRNAYRRTRRAQGFNA